MTVWDEPCRIDAVVTEIILLKGWRATRSEAEELAENWRDRCMAELARQIESARELGGQVVYEFNSSAEYTIQGCAFMEPGDTPGVRDAKRRRASYVEIADAMSRLSPKEFEWLCKGILRELGVADPTVTPYGGDEGIDFFGKLQLRALWPDSDALPGLVDNLAVWMVGQAKHYKRTQVSTPDIRELIGLVVLARGSAFGRKTPAFDLDARVCDPTFYLFFTTGVISADGRRLLERSGAVGLDGLGVAAFLADRGVGCEHGAFAEVGFRSWVLEHGA